MSDPPPTPRPDTTAEPTRLTVVVPAYNEAGRLAHAAARLQAATGAGAYDPSVTELVVVDDGSTDGTAELAERLLLAGAPHGRLVRLVTNAGKGAAVRAGVAVARSATVAFIDADMAIDPSQLPALLGALGRADVAIGSKRLPGSATDPGSSAGMRLGRRVMSRAYNRLVTLSVGLQLSDTQCGFKAFATPEARLLFHLGSIDRFAFDVELLRRAHQLGLSVAEVPVHWQVSGGSRIRPLADPASMLADLGRIGIGRPAPRPVPGLVVAPPAGAGLDGDLAAAARRLAGPCLPLRRAADGSLVLLCPLCAEAEVVMAQLALEDAAAGSGATVTQRAFGLAELRGLGATDHRPVGDGAARRSGPG